MTPQEKLKYCRTFDGKAKRPSIPDRLGFFWEAEYNWVNNAEPVLEDGETIESVLQDYHLYEMPLAIPDELKVMMLSTIRRVLLGRGYQLEEKERLSEKFHSLYADFIKTTSK